MAGRHSDKPPKPVRQPPSSPGQVDINWTLTERRRLLDDCAIPDVVAKDRVTVSAGFALSVLRKIGEFAIASGECFASLPTLAEALKRSVRHAKRAVAALESLSLITCETRRTNHYRIVWTEVALRSKFRPQRSALDGSGSALPTTRSALPTTRSALPTTRSALQAHNGSIKKDDINPDPDPEAASEDFANAWGAERTFNCPPPVKEEATKDRQQARTSALEALIDRVPELQAARWRPIGPLAPGSLIYGGAFQSLTEAILRQPPALTLWFRRQLGWDFPVIGNTGAHLLIVFATARYALMIPPHEVRRNRVAAFVGAINLGQWFRALRHIPAVTPLLDSPEVEVELSHPDFSDPQPSQPKALVAAPIQQPTLGEDLEPEWGPRLDALSPESLRELANGLNDFVGTRFRKNHNDFVARSYLLKLLSSRLEVHS